MKMLKVFVCILLLICIPLTYVIFSNKINIDNFINDISCGEKVIGVLGATSFDFDDDGNVYIAFNHKINLISSDNREETIISDNSLDIYDIAYYKEKLIIATGTEILSYNLKDEKVETIVSNLPNKGLNKELKLLVADEKLFVAVGSNTNSGVADTDYQYEDTPTFNWNLRLKNYGDENTGPFMPYGVGLKQNDKVEGHIISNGVVVTINLTTMDIQNYATGISKVNGFDLDSKGNLFAIFNGLQDEGLRPIKNDKDYLYQVEENQWYGWPDFSGGDSLTSPRFTEDGDFIERIILNPISQIPKGPIYQHSKLNSLNGLAIDKDGVVFSRDSILIGDNKNQCLYEMGENRLLKEIIKFGEKSYLTKIKIIQGKVYILDSGSGTLLEVAKSNMGVLLRMPIQIKIFSMIFIAIVFICTTFVMLRRKKRSIY